jgi:hypothetical protein
MNLIELAWSAGFFDGEGCVCFKTPKSMLPYMGISQQNREVLDRFQAAVRIGKVYGPYFHPSGKSVFTFAAAGHEKVQAIIAQLWNNLGIVKRKQAAAILTSYINTRARAGAREGGRGGR